MAKRKLMGYKHRVTNPKPVPGEPVLPDGVVDWVLRRDHRVVMHQILAVDEVDTPDGQMLLCKIKQQAEFAHPDVDIAVLVGQAKTYRKTGRLDPQSPELWYYNDKFWLKAKNSDGSEYYNFRQEYLLYKVEVREADKLIASTCTGFEIDAEPSAK